MSDDPVDWLYALQSHGIKLGLDGIRGLLGLLGHPQDGLTTILVGGTNGKGSVAAMLAAMLQAHGRTTGLYTSPHLVRPEERVRLGDADIARRALETHLLAIRDACARGLGSGALAAHPSFFEVVTAAGLLAFREARVEVAVLEVGLGGRLDATNVTSPVVSAIVTVDLDHVATLGATLPAIAREKAAIARRSRPLVSGVAQPEAVTAIRRSCEEIGAIFVDASHTPLPDDVRVPLEGGHQRENAAVALRVLEEFARGAGFRVDPRAVALGLSRTRWPGRLQLVPGSPPLLLDGAHNPAGAQALAAHLAARGGPRPVLLFAAMEDKDVAGLVGPLAARVERAVAVRPDVSRAMDALRLAERVRDAGLPAEAAATPAAGLARARALAGPDGLVLVAGSLYLVGAVLGLLDGREAPGPVAM